MFIVWHADLNSLYGDAPNPPVVYERVKTAAEASAMVAELQDHETAAWFEEGKDHEQQQA